MISDFYDPRQTPTYLVTLILAAKFLSRWIWTKSESTEILASTVATNTQAIAALSARFDDGQTRLSNKLGDVNTHLGTIDITLAELKTELKFTRPRADLSGV